MPETIACSQCGSPLRLPEAYIGREVRCPSCQETFTARLPDEPRERLPASYPDLQDNDDEEEARLKRRRRAYEQARRARERVQPHRGGTVLALGVISLCLCCIPAISLGLGIGAVVMGSRDLARIRNGAMDPAGRGRTRAGVVCGILGPILTIIFVAMFIVFAQLP